MITKSFRFVLYLIAFVCFTHFEAHSKVEFTSTNVLCSVLLAFAFWLVSEFLVGRFLPFLAGNRLAFSAPCGSSMAILERTVIRQQIFVLVIDTIICLAFVQAANEINPLGSGAITTQLLKGVFLFGALFVDGTIQRSISSKTIINYARECVPSENSCPRCASLNPASK